jgi:hypothetical protein
VDVTAAERSFLPVILRVKKKKTVTKVSSKALCTKTFLRSSLPLSSSSPPPF